MNTPLHIALQNGNVEIVKALLADGCDFNARNADGQTPLELATAMNNEELVRLLLEHGAGRAAPPPEASPFLTTTLTLDAPRRKKRINFWLLFLLFTLGLLTFVGIISSLIDIAIWSNNHPREARKMSEALSMPYFIVFFLPCLAAYLACYFFYLFRLWQEVPHMFARTTPETAAGLSLIPVFSWYWMFVALGGLYKDMNKTMEYYGQSKRFNATMIIVICVLWLAGDLFSIMFGLLMAAVSFAPQPGPFMVVSDIFLIVYSLVWTICTAVVYFIIRKNVLEFVDIKAGLEK